MTRLLAIAALSLSSLALAAPPATARLPDTWANRASFFIGARGGVAVPPGAVGLAPNAGIEIGVAVPTGFGFGVRALWMNNPPGLPLFSLKPAEYGFGALADFRYYIETVDPLIIYPTLSLGFLAGPERISQQNAVLPLINPGVGVKVKFGNLYGAFEFGVSGFTIPFVVFAIGYDGDSKLTKQAEQLRLAENERLAAAAAAPVVAPVVAPATTPAAP
jgi:hypothetical protein